MVLHGVSSKLGVSRSEELTDCYRQFGTDETQGGNIGFSGIKDGAKTLKKSGVSAALKKIGSGFKKSSSTSAMLSGVDAAHQNGKVHMNAALVGSYDPNEIIMSVQQNTAPPVPAVKSVSSTILQAPSSSIISSSDKPTTGDEILQATSSGTQESDGNEPLPPNLFTAIEAVFLEGGMRTTPTKQQTQVMIELAQNAPDSKNTFSNTLVEFLHSQTSWQMQSKALGLIEAAMKEKALKSSIRNVLVQRCTTLQNLCLAEKVAVQTKATKICVSAGLNVPKSHLPDQTSGNTIISAADEGIDLLGFQREKSNSVADGGSAASHDVSSTDLFSGLVVFPPSNSTASQVDEMHRQDSSQCSSASFTSSDDSRDTSLLPTTQDPLGFSIMPPAAASTRGPPAAAAAASHLEILSLFDGCLVSPPAPEAASPFPPNQGGSSAVDAAGGGTRSAHATVGAVGAARRSGFSFI